MARSSTDGLKGGKAAARAAEGNPRAPKRRPWAGSLGPAMLGSVLLWASLPPLQLGFLAFLAPVPWILLIRLGRMPGGRPYGSLWLAGFLFWFAMLHWIRMPHPATSIGWVALSGYLAFYLPVFVGLARVAVHRLAVPVILAAPVVWTGLELARGHVFGGFTMASLGHSQYRWIELIQVGDLAGCYGVGFVVMFVAASLGRMLPLSEDGRRTAKVAPWPLIVAAAMLAAAVGYGRVRMAGVPAEPAARIALIQGSIDITLEPDPDRAARMHIQYVDLTQDALARHERIDLIVWPETVFGCALFTNDAGAAVPDDWPGEEEEFLGQLDDACENSRRNVGQVAGRFRTPMLVGITRQHYGPSGPRVYNSAAFVQGDGQLVGWYDKNHLVMFGEYFPFADKLTWLYDFTPVNTLGLGLEAGSEPAAFNLGDLRVAPNICYESVIPQVIRNQVNRLADQGREPDVLVNLTNDGWFRGSSELDLHMICGVFRAVECRKPFLIAANTGISAWIDGDGRIRAQGPHRATDTILAEVAADGRDSLYLRWGDLPAGVCLAVCAIFAAIALADRLRRTGTTGPNRPPTPS